MAGRFFIVWLILAGCQSRYGSDPILIPVVTDSYYQKSVSALEERIEENPEDVRVIRLQLDYYERLGWPIEASGAVYRSFSFMKGDPVMLKQGINFYLKNEMHEELLEMISKQENQSILPRSIQQQKINALIASNQYGKARGLLVDFINTDTESREQLFYGKAYLDMGDSVLAVFYFNRLLKSNGLNDELTKAAAGVWNRFGLHVIVIQALQEFSGVMDDNQVLILADSYHSMGQKTKAKQLLWGKQNWEMNQVLSGWYQVEQKWDSAHLALNSTFLSEDNQLEALILHGNIDQERGWYNSSLSFYGQVLARDSSNSEAQNQTRNVNRKIAYLQRIKEMQQEMPTLNLTSKKISN